MKQTQFTLLTVQ